MKGKRLTTVAGALVLLLAPMAPAFADLVSQAPAKMCSTNSTQASSDNDNREVAASVVIGTTLYFGGKFNQVVDVDGTVLTRNHLAACSIATGHVLPWDPNMEPPAGSTDARGGDVYALATDGHVLYAGGAFDRVGGETVKGGLVALDPNPNVATPAKVGFGGNPAPGISSNSIKALALSPDNKTLYIGGSFTKAGVKGQVAADRTGAAAFSTETGALLDWAPSLVTETEATCPPDDPTCVAERPKPVEIRGLVARADKVIAVGYFKLPGTSDDSGHMAAFNTTNGNQVSWDEKPEWPIISIWGTATSDRIYVGGAGQGVSKNTVMAIDPADGKKKWQINGDGNMQAVYSLGGVVYVGGHFHFIGNKDRVRSQDPAYNRETLAAFTEGQDKPLDWNPGTNNAGNGVYSFSSGPAGLIAGGSFSRVAGAKQMGLARFALDFPTVSSSSPASLGVGTSDYPVTVTGTKFADTPTLSFGDDVTVGSVQWVSPTQVVARITIAPNAATGPRDVIVTNPSGDSGLCKGCLTIATTPPPPPPGCPPDCPQNTPGGYHLVASDGGIFAFGDAQFFGSTGNLKLAKPIVGMAETPAGRGYWLLASDGGVFAFGDAAFFGSTGNIKLAQPIVGMASTPSGKGYWMVASDGGIFAFGDAKFFGSTGNIKLAKPIVGMSSTPSGNGYWMVASDGGVFAFGDAAFQGSTGNLKLAKPIVGMTTTKTGRGYWMVASDGGVFAFGDAAFKGSTGNIKLAQPIVGMTTTASGAGYYMVASDGGIFAFGDAAFKGSTGNIKLAKPIVGMASK
jgi:hypothetical protein